jgi:hypothetical protein
MNQAFDEKISINKPDTKLPLACIFFNLLVRFENITHNLSDASLNLQEQKLQVDIHDLWSYV